MNLGRKFLAFLGAIGLALVLSVPASAFEYERKARDWGEVPSDLAGLCTGNDDYESDVYRTIGDLYGINVRHVKPEYVVPKNVLDNGKPVVTCVGWGKDRDPTSNLLLVFRATMSPVDRTNIGTVIGTCIIAVNKMHSLIQLSVLTQGWQLCDDWQLNLPKNN